MSDNHFFFLWIQFKSCLWIQYVLHVTDSAAIQRAEFSSHPFQKDSLLLTVNLANIFVQRNKNASQKCFHGQLVSFYNSW